jgi:tripartite-type tricarboxylate transporter receptor subunit TctC
MIAYAKANPSKLSFGTPGVATMPHLAAELLQLQAGMKLTHIPYKGATQQIQDLMAGVTLGFSELIGGRLTATQS